MRRSHCDTIAIVNNERERRPVGVINGGDISRTSSANGSDAMKQPVDGWMSTPIVAVFLDTLAAECVDAMALHSLDYVVVIYRQGRLQGAMRPAQ
jgi:CBS domain-containing protein